MDYQGEAKASHEMGSPKLWGVDRKQVRRWCKGTRPGGRSWHLINPYGKTIIIPRIWRGLAAGLRVDGYGPGHRIMARRISNASR